jgi:chitinase
VSLLRELREALTELGTETGKYYYLSTAVPMTAIFNEQNDPHLAAKYVDAIKVMCYDNAGSWSRPLHHANLYNNSTQTNSTHAAVVRYLNQGVPPEKLMLGFPTYGKEWRGVPAGPSASLPGYNQSPYTWGSNISYHPTIKDYLSPDSGFTRYWDDVAKAPALYNPTLNGGTFVSYFDKEQLRYLVEYVKEKGLGGVFYWEYADDMEADLLRAVHENAVK